MAAGAWVEVRRDSTLWVRLGCYGEDVPGVWFREAAAAPGTAGTQQFTGPEQDEKEVIGLYC